MDKNKDFSMQDALRLAQSPAGRQLLTALQQQNDAQLQKVISAATAGDYEKAKSSLSSLLDAPEIQALLKQLGGGHG